MRTLLLDKIEVNYIPRTTGSNDPQKKEELRDKILGVLDERKIDINLLRQRCKNADYLSLDITFNILQHKTEIGRTRKDLDNLLKIVLDILPERFSVQDKTKERLGLGLIEGDNDTKVFEIHCLKKKVTEEKREGIELEIYGLSEDEVSLQVPGSIVQNF